MSSGRSDSRAVRRRHINFEQIESTIKQLVSDASNDVRAQYGHLLSAGAVNQSLMQRRVASELMMRLANSATQGQELNVRIATAATLFGTRDVLVNEVGRDVGLVTNQETTGSTSSRSAGGCV